MSSHEDQGVDMNVATPPRSLRQRREALERANEVRSARARLKRDIAAGRADVAAVADVLRNPPEWLLSGKVYDLLLAMPRVGRVRTVKLLERARVSPVKTVGGLTPRQREELAKGVARLEIGAWRLANLPQTVETLRAMVAAGSGAYAADIASEGCWGPYQASGRLNGVRRLGFAVSEPSETTGLLWTVTDEGLRLLSGWDAVGSPDSGTNTQGDNQ